MHAVECSIKEVDNLKIFSPEKKLNMFSFFNAIKNYEQKFYQKNADYTKQSYCEVIDELKGKIDAKKLLTPDKAQIDIWDINPYNCKKYIIFCEGISSEKSNLLQQLAYLKFIRAGWGVVAFDYRGRGKSKGIFSQKAACIDTKTVYEYLKSSGIKESDIGVIGHSMGSAIAADFCSKYKTAFTVLINPFSKAADMAKNIAQKAKLPKIINKIIQKLPSFLIPLQNRFDNESAIKKIKTPVLILHTKKDCIIPVEFARKLYSKTFLKKDVSYKELEGNDHEINEEKIDCCIKYMLQKSGKL